MARNHTVLTATDMVTLRSLFCLGNHKSKRIHAFSTVFKIRGTAAASRRTKLVVTLAIIDLSLSSL